MLRAMALASARPRRSRLRGARPGPHRRCADRRAGAEAGGLAALAAGPAPALRPARLRQGAAHGRRHRARCRASRRWTTSPTLLALKVEVAGLERLPRQGRLIVVCNHPTGIADGVAVYDALRTVRPDIAVLRQRRRPPGRAAVRRGPDPGGVGGGEAHPRAHPPDPDLTREAMEAERALVIFPAGRLARRRPGGPRRPALGAPAPSRSRASTTRRSLPAPSGRAVVDPVPPLQPLLAASCATSPCSTSC